VAVDGRGVDDGVAAGERRPHRRVVGDVGLGDLDGGRAAERLQRAPDARR
jgi:hypothetical protein